MRLFETPPDRADERVAISDDGRTRVTYSPENDDSATLTWDVWNEGFGGAQSDGGYAPGWDTSHMAAFVKKEKAIKVFEQVIYT